MLVLSRSIEKLKETIIFPLTKLFLLLREGKNGGVRFAFGFYILFLFMGLITSEQCDCGFFQHRTLIDIAYVTERKAIS